MTSPASTPTSNTNYPSYSLGSSTAAGVHTTTSVCLGRLARQRWHAWRALTTTFPVSATEMTQAPHSGQRNAQGARPTRTACHATASAPSTSHWSRPWEYRTDATRLTSTKLCIKGILPPFHTPRNSPASHGGTVKGRVCTSPPVKSTSPYSTRAAKASQSATELYWRSM